MIVLNIIIGILIIFMSLIGAAILLIIGLTLLTLFSDEEDYSHYPLIDFFILSSIPSTTKEE